jgi:hypothetical protein
MAVSVFSDVHLLFPCKYIESKPSVKIKFWLNHEWDLQNKIALDHILDQIIFEHFFEYNNILVMSTNIFLLAHSFNVFNVLTFFFWHWLTFSLKLS